MDAISSSVTSTLKLSAPTTLPSTHHLKTPNLLTHQQHNRSRRTSLSSSSRRNSFTHTTTTTSRSDPSLPRPSHKRASTGYAAALLDIAQCNNALAQVESDVRRFSRLLGKVLEHPEAAAEKGRVVKDVAAAGRFHKTLVGLVNMLVDKKKSVDLVAEVMEEFQRIYDQLAGTAVVLVSSPAKMERDEILGIAQRVQMISGAAKVKVNNLVAPRQSSFAH